MRHVPLADLQANAAELTAAMDAGEEVMISLGGRGYKLVAASDLIEPDAAAIVERRRQALEELRASRAELRAQGVSVTREDVRAWINEGRC